MSSAELTKNIQKTLRIPTELTLQHACRLAISEDKPIMMDYWTFSIDKTALIGVKQDGEKLLVKDANEYTSAISKMYKVATEYIIITENSIYIVDIAIPTKKINSGSSSSVATAEPKTKTI